MPLTLSDVSHRYGSNRWILEDVSVTILEGESVALLGPSGSGKTTLLSIIGLLLRPTAGQLCIDGQQPPTGERAISRLRAAKYAWVFQSSNALGRRSAIDNASLGLLAKGSTRRQAEIKARNALSAVGLSGHGDQPANQLSGGELQRMCIARAMASEPRYLLADEPTGQLDQHTSSEVLDALWAACGSDTALLIATHDAGAANRCDRIVRLENGRLVE
jgi:ABC-type lipoprotein export system ATPase subunit